MSGTLLRLIPGVVCVGLLTVLALTQTGGAISTDLSGKADAVLAPTAKSWATISVDGRTLVLGGTATSKADIATAAAALSAVPGSAGVRIDVALAEPVSPYPFAVSVEKSKLTLSGAYPDADTKASWAGLVAPGGDATTLHSGAPRNFGDAATAALATAALFDQGKVTLSDSVMTIDGRARDATAFGALQNIRAALPPDVTVAAVNVVPPLASPYVWTARFDGRTLTISGDAPSPALADTLRTIVPSGIDAKITLAPASGEPAGFEANTLALLKTLLTLESGEVRISDQTTSLSGAPGSAAVAEAAKAQAVALGATVALEPPRVASYSFAIAKADGKLAFTGFVPDAAMRKRLAESTGGDVERLDLARGAPEGFDAATALGVTVLGRLKSGAFSLDGSKVTVSGKAGTLDDYTAVIAALAAPLPAGLSFAATEIHPPVADPFTWSATRAADGTIAFTGYVPSEAVRASLRNAVAKPGKDEARLAEGAPDTFARSAAKGLEILQLLDSGTLAFDGKAWSLEGNVDSAKKGLAADAAYSIAGLRTAGWTYNVRLPALPIIAPYVFRAQKAADGTVAYSGFVPDDTVKDSLASAGADATVLGAGAPADFTPALRAGLDALAALDQGALSLTGERWTLAGEVADIATRDRIQATLTAAVNATNWQVAIQARGAAPVVTPYLWSADKASDGTIGLTGYVPGKDVLATLTALAKGQGGNLSIASGEPAGFAADALAGLAALEHLSRGKVSFDGRSWALTGSVDTQADGAAAMAALAGATNGAKLWTITLAGYDPSIPAPASSAESSSSASANESSRAAESAVPSSSDVSVVSSSSETASSEPSVAASSEPPVSSAASEASSAASASEEPSASATSEASSSAVASASVAPEASASSSVAASTDASASSAERAVPTAIEVTTPLPDNLVFAAKKVSSGGISLSGKVPAKDVATALAKAAGASGAKLAVDATLPSDFAAAATAGIAALATFEDGQLGFDGTRWWLHGRVASDSIADAARQQVAALPGGGGWSVELKVLDAFDLCRVRADAVSSRNDIAFEAGKRNLSPDSLAVIDELAKDLAVCPEAIIHVQAHTDGDGDAQANLVLSVARAETVVSELAKRGISDQRLYAEGFGESAPVVANDTKTNKAKNRRIVIVVSKD